MKERTAILKKNPKSLLQLAQEYYAAGNFLQSEKTCRELLRSHPNNAEAHYQLGRALQAQGRLDDALACFHKAIGLNPALAAAHHSAGNIHQARGRLDDALACFHKAIGLNPDAAVSYNNLGNILLEKGQPEQAILYYQKAIQLQPDFTAAYGNLAMAYYSLAHAFRKENRFDDAVHAYQKSVQLNPRLKEAYLDMGTLFQEKGRFDEALACYQKITEIDPGNAQGYSATGTVLQKKGRLNEAMAYYQKALQINPGLPEAYNNLGTVCRDKGMFDEAAMYYQKALQMNPGFPEAYNNLGTVFRDNGQLEHATENYRRAIDLNSDFAEAHWNLAFTLLLAGDFRNGWKEYEWRWKIQDHYLHGITKPLWDGADISGRTILIHAEQGLGDTIQFVRYAPLVANRGAKLIFACQKEITGLLRQVKGLDTVIPYGEALPGFDLHCPILRLPLVFETTIENIPATIPYITADHSLVTTWSDRIDKKNETFKIGLAWAGRPTHLNDRNRSLPLALFSPFARLERIELYSLQKGEAAEQAKHSPGGIRLFDYTGELRDFSDTAALMEHLDLVISVDTAVAHLAGAMGKPVWTLLPFAPDWRWMLNRDDSPWYPTMRLFRQPSRGDWMTVIDRVIDALEKERRR